MNPFTSTVSSAPWHSGGPMSVTLRNASRFHRVLSVGKEHKVQWKIALFLFCSFFYSYWPRTDSAEENGSRKSTGECQSKKCSITFKGKKPFAVFRVYSDEESPCDQSIGRSQRNYSILLIWLRSSEARSPQKHPRTRQLVLLNKWRNPRAAPRYYVGTAMCSVRETINLNEWSDKDNI